MDSIESSKKIVESYYEKKTPSEEDDNLFVEALEYLIEKTGELKYATQLGGFYYEQKNFDLALKYYLLGAEANDKYALLGLGYIYYYGRCGEVDYKRAFDYYSRASELGLDEAALRISDMYYKGKGVKKDLGKSKEILYALYEKEKNTDLVYSVFPEVVIRLSSYWIKDNQKKKAYNELLKAKNFVKSRLVYNAFFGEFNNMENIVNRIYECISFDKSKMDIYDLFYYFKKPGKASFKYDNKTYQINSDMDGRFVSIEFEGKWYQEIKEFLMRAIIENKKISALAYYIVDVKGE
jgi:hypothetical protein